MKHPGKPRSRTETGRKTAQISRSDRAVVFRCSSCCVYFGYRSQRTWQGISRVQIPPPVVSLTRKASCVPLRAQKPRYPRFSKRRQSANSRQKAKRPSSVKRKTSNTASYSNSEQPFTQNVLLHVVQVFGPEDYHVVVLIGEPVVVALHDTLRLDGSPLSPSFHWSNASRKNRKYRNTSGDGQLRGCLHGGSSALRERSEEGRPRRLQRRSLYRA